MKNQISKLFVVSLLFASPVFAAEDVVNVVEEVVENVAPVALTYAERAKALWTNSSTATSKWFSTKGANIASWKDSKVANFVSFKDAKVASLSAAKTAASDRLNFAKVVAKSFWNADREDKKFMAQAAFDSAKTAVSNNKVNLGGSALAAVAAYKVLSCVPFLNTDKRLVKVSNKRGSGYHYKAPKGFTKYAKVTTKLAASTALFAYLTATQRPDQLATWVKGFMPKKAIATA